MEQVGKIDFQTLRSNLNSIKSPLKVLYFYTEGSEECKQISDVLGELVSSKEYKNAVFFKIDANQNKEVCEKFGIDSVPCVVFDLDKESSKLVGADVPNLVKMLKSYHEKADSIASKSEKELNERLKKLINKSPCMLFMKGSAETPRCGFSKQVIALLKGHNAKFQTFDILEDMDVRQGLKVYSDWPTYPQLYVNGELIGGLDILKELSASGELDNIVPKL